MDNGGAGGILAGICADTGQVFTDAFDEAGTQYITHTDTGFRFKGSFMERWDECVALSKELAKQFPTMRLIGWDLALSKDTGWIVVEANPRGQFYLYQLMTQTGMKKHFLEQLEWKKHIQNDRFAVFIKGVVFHDRIKALAGDSRNVTAFKRADTLPKYRVMTEANNVADPTSPEPIYAWFDNGTIYYYTNAPRPYLNINPSGMFQNLSSLNALDLSPFRTEHSLYFDFMFYNCKSLTSLDFSGFDTSKATQMNKMFYGCSSLVSLNLSSFDTSKVKNMQAMFYGCSNLTELDISSFNTSSVTNMARMFENCSSLRTLDVTGFDTSRVKDMQLMFSGCSQLYTHDFSGFVISSETNTTDMYAGCPTDNTLLS